MSTLKTIYKELRERGVVRIGALYIGIGWMIIESGSILLPLFEVPDTTFRWIVVALFLGFPIALVLAWMFELTKNGVVRDEAALRRDLPSHSTGRTLDFIAIGVLMAALTLSLYLNYQVGIGTTKGTNQREPLALLIADFGNTTGEPLFAGVLEEALHIGMEGASFISAFSRERALQIAKLIDPKTTVLDSSRARLVAVREEIKLVLSGDAHTNAGGFIVRIAAIDPASGDTIVEVSQAAGDKLGVLEVVAELSRKIRKKLGDVEIEESGESFTASTLNALSEYITAQSLTLDDEFEQALVHYEAAVKEDPSFGRALAGWALAAFELGQSQLAEELWADALALLGGMSERERLRTTGIYYALSS